MTGTRSMSNSRGRSAELSIGRGMEWTQWLYVHWSRPGEGMSRPGAGVKRLG